MSNIFSESKGVTETNTSKTEEFNKLLNIRLARELTKFHNPILSIIMEDPNEALKDLFTNEIPENHKIALEADDSKQTIRANFLNKDNNRSSFVDMSPQEDTVMEKITPETYDKLNEYAQDPLLVMQNVKEDLQKSAI